MIVKGSSKPIEPVQIQWIFIFCPMLARAAINVPIITRKVRQVLVSLDEMGLLMKKANTAQIIFVLFLLLIVPFVALLILWGSRRLYSPLGNLVQELNASGRLELSDNGNDDWSAISRAVNELMREERRLFSDNEREKLKEATFLRILAGESTDDDEEVKKILPYRRNMCILAAIDARSSQLSKIKNYDSRIRLLIWLIEDELKAEGICPTAMRYEDNAIVLILSVDDTIQDFEQILLTRLAMIQAKAVKVMDYTISFAISSLNDTPSSAPLSFDQQRM